MARRIGVAAFTVAGFRAPPRARRMPAQYVASL
jgi:hypothetical protein